MVNLDNGHFYLVLAHLISLHVSLYNVNRVCCIYNIENKSHSIFKITNNFDWALQITWFFDQRIRFIRYFQILFWIIRIHNRVIPFQTKLNLSVDRRWLTDGAQLKHNWLFGMVCAEAETGCAWYNRHRSIANRPFRGHYLVGHLWHALR